MELLLWGYWFAGVVFISAIWFFGPDTNPLEPDEFKIISFILTISIFG